MEDKIEDINLNILECKGCIFICKAVIFYIILI